MPALTALRASGSRVRQLYLEASTDVLVRRYESSRRRHPLLASGEGLADAIDRERALLEPLRAEADVLVDTSALNVHQLHDRIVGLFGEAHADVGMQTRVVSFGYKHGLPVDVDLVLDCRFLPNPHWVEELRPLTGLDDAVRRYVLEQEHTEPFLTHLDALLELLVPAYVAEGKSYLTRRLRVHRRTPSLRGHRRGGRRAPASSAAPPRRWCTGTSTSDPSPTGTLWRDLLGWPYLAH